MTDEWPIVGGTSEGSNVTWRSQDDLLAVVEKVLPETYTAAMKTSPDSGYEDFQGQAAQFSRASVALARLENGLVALFAEGGAYALGYVEFYRDASGALPGLVLQRGTVVRTSRGRQRAFILQNDVQFDPGDPGPFTATVAAALRGWEWNLPGRFTSAGGEVIDGPIDTVQTFVQADLTTGERGVFDATIQVRQVDATFGGSFPMLDMLGQDRGMPRWPGEPDVAYRARIRSLADVVTPGAIVRTVQRILLPFGAEFDVLEPFNPQVQTVWNAPRYPACPDVFLYNDPRGPVPVRNLWLDSTTYRGSLIVAVGPIQPLYDTSLIGDSTDTTAADRVSPLSGGVRAVCAGDLPTSILSASTPIGVADGGDEALRAVYVALYSALTQVKPAGVAVVLMRRGVN